MANSRVERNKANFKRFQEECLGKGDMSLLPELMAPQMLVRRAANDALMRINGVDIPEHREWTREQFIEAFTSFAGAHPPKRKVLEAYGEGDVVCARWTLEHTHDDDRYGIPPTGRPYVTEEVGIVRFDDEGRVVEGWFVADSLDVFHQIGAKLALTPPD